MKKPRRSFWTSASSTALPHKVWCHTLSLNPRWPAPFWLAELSNNWKWHHLSQQSPKQKAHQIRWGQGSLLGSWPPPTPPPGSAQRSGPVCPPGEPGIARCFAGTGWGCDKVLSPLFLLQPLRECYIPQCLEQIREKKLRKMKLKRWQWHKILQTTRNIMASELIVKIVDRRVSSAIFYVTK